MLCVISLCMLLQGGLRRRGGGKPVENTHCRLNYAAKHSHRHLPRLLTHTHRHVPVEVMVGCHSTLTAYGWEGEILIKAHFSPHKLDNKYVNCAKPHRCVSSRVTKLETKSVGMVQTMN